MVVAVFVWELGMAVGWGAERITIQEGCTARTRVGG